MTVQTKSWSEVVQQLVEYAAKNPDYEPIARFAEEVATSRYAFELFPYLSMNTLGIAQTAEIREYQERFLVQYDPVKSCLRFAYTDSTSWLSSSPPGMRGRASWYRECSGENAFESFERYISQVGWSSAT